MADKQTSSASNFSGRQYFVELFGAFLIYAAVLFGTIGRVEDAEPGLVKMALALAPVAPLILVFWAIMRQYNRSDEMHKRMVREAFALGSVIFGWLLIIWGFAQNGGAPQVPAIFMAPALIGLWGVCTPIVIRRYK